MAQPVGAGVRFVWRNLGRAVEDGSFDQGTSYFIMNPGERISGRLPFVGDVTYFAGLGPDSLTTVHDATRVPDGGSLCSLRSLESEALLAG